MHMIKYLGRCITGAAILFAGILLVGCGGGSKGGFRYDPLADGRAPMMGGGTPTQPVEIDQVLHVGDTITVSFADLPNPVFPIDQAVKEDGSITLIYNQ